MRILLVGDVMGRSGRAIVSRELPRLRERLQVDLAIVNAENATHGKGLIPKHAEGIFDAGADVITLGNHGFAERAILVELGREPRIIRPVNIARIAPGEGHAVVENSKGDPVLVLNALGRLYADRVYGEYLDPIEAALTAHPLGTAVATAVLDFHAEASSEKQALAHHLDGRLSLLAGTHTHVPTSDHRVLPGGTAYITDVGMTGCYHSVIGSKIEEPVSRLVTGLHRERLEPALERPTLCAVLVETDDRTGLARSVSPVCTGGDLAEVWPEGY